MQDKIVGPALQLIMMITGKMQCQGCRDRGRSIIGGDGGRDIHIFKFTERKKQSISKEVNNVQHEYMNIAPSQLTIFCGPWVVSINQKYRGSLVQLLLVYTA